MTPSTLVRRARLVAVGTPAPWTDPVDLRIRDGVFTELAPALDAEGDDQVLDADGRWLIPGLWDQHVHFTMWARLRGMLDVSGAGDAASVVRLVGEHVAGRSGTEPVVGFGYRSAMWPIAPTVAQLDTASGDVPVVLTAGDGHNGWLNSAALQAVGVPGRTDAIDEREWFELQPRVAALTASAVDTDVVVREAVNEASSRGVVGIVDFEMPDAYATWPDRVAAGLDSLRVRATVYPERLDDVVAAGLRTGQPLTDDGLVTMGPLKIISDGSLNTRTANCCEPYADAGDHAYPRGKQNFEAAELASLLGTARQHGLDAAVHAIGDAAVDLALGAFETTGAHGGVEHAQLMRREDIPRMARLGVRASVQPAHLWDDRDVTFRCWPDRADRCFPFRSMLDAGVDVVLGSDAPVAPLDPWLAMAAAVHRSGDEREPWNAAESLTPSEALAASTDGATTVAVGSLGDLVLLDDDPLGAFGDTAEAAGRLRGVGVWATLVGGRPTYRAE